MKNHSQKEAESCQAATTSHLDGSVAVIGAGVTGASWAALFTAHGRPVLLYDEDPERSASGVERARTHIRFLLDHDMADPHQAETGVRTLRSCATLSETVEKAAFIQEAVFERYEVKRAVFEAIDRHAPRQALIVTSSSGLSISRIQTATRYPDRCLAGHPYNPPHLIPLVEMAPGTHTAPEALETARRFYESMGRVPVVLTRDIPGYLANRMSAALWREAINLVLDGVASVADVDRAIHLGPGLRWAVMGPHLLYHLGGGEGGIRRHIEHLRAAKEAMWHDMSDWKTMPAETTEALEQGLPGSTEIVALTQERDEMLVRIIKALRPSQER